MTNDDAPQIPERVTHRYGDEDVEYRRVRPFHVPAALVAAAVMAVVGAAMGAPWWIAIPLPLLSAVTSALIMRD